MKASKGKRKSADELFANEALKPESEIDLGRAALFIAKSEYPGLNVDLYLRRLDEIAESIDERLPSAQSGRDPQKIIEQINEHLFEELSFRGNVENYYDPRNSFLNEVLDRRTGIPITLSVIYIEVARRLGLKVEGVGMPGHFLVRCHINNKDIILDPFNKGRSLTEADCEQLLSGVRPSLIHSRDLLNRAGNLGGSTPGEDGAMTRSTTYSH